MSFEDEIMRALNPDAAQVARQHEAGAQPLPLSTLLPMLQQGQTRPLQRLQLDATGQRLSMARFEGGQQHWRYFDPYSGQQFTALRGAGFFAFVEDLHRRLVSGDRGRLVTGSCAIALVFFCLSGLYMRWPRRWWHWRTWLAVEWTRSGRSFLWSLHSVVGTWVLPVYLMIALTGLWWSFGWYRDGVTAVLVGERSEPADAKAAAGPLDLEKVQATLYALDGVRRGSIDLRFPAKPGKPLTARVRGSDAEHDRAQDIVQLDPVSGARLQYEPYAGKDVGGKVVVSMFALHSGSFFGLPGRVIVMVSSLCMLVFFVTGWMLYLDRRRRKREVRAARLPAPTLAGNGTPWLVAFASQSGVAEQLAWRAAAQLQAAGATVVVRPLGQLDAATLQQTGQALFVASTFGDGEAPDAARVFERRLLTRPLPLPNLRYGLLGLGDTGYARFCGFSRALDRWLGEQGAQRLFPTVEVDRDDAVALAQWQQQLGAISGNEDVSPLPVQAPLQAWPLHGRRLLNLGSAAGPVWEISLAAPAHTTWQAGDILEVAPRHADAYVVTVLEALGLAPDALVEIDGEALALRDAAAQRVLPAPDHAAPVTDAGAWLSTLTMLPHREYSIASAAQDDHLQLVVRLTRQPDGRHGLGSGWLCVHAPQGTPVQARVRRNSGFHRFPEHAPMLLIGNGTGIAG
ncbi:MAG: PepSY domain-containing protein, partial [Stenotrophomonas sp.]